MVLVISFCAVVLFLIVPLVAERFIARRHPERSPPAADAVEGSLPSVHSSGEVGVLRLRAAARHSAQDGVRDGMHENAISHRPRPDHPVVIDDTGDQPDVPIRSMLRSE